MEVETKYVDGIAFEMNPGSFTIPMDGDPKFGGKNKGATPKQILLGALAGCTGMDVVSILKKMKVSFLEFSIKVQAEKSQTEPIVFTKIHIQYIFNKVSDKDKAQKAVELSQEKYCGISNMLKKAAEVTWELVYK